VVTESTPPPDAEDPDWRAALVGRYQAVAPVLKVLPGVITFGATAEGAPVLAAMQALPDVLAYRSRLKAPLVPVKLIDPGVVPGPWQSNGGRSCNPIVTVPTLTCGNRTACIPRHTASDRLHAKAVRAFCPVPGIKHA
jgi:hypothetical protein